MPDQVGHGKGTSFHPQHSGKLFTNAGLLFLWSGKDVWEKFCSTAPTFPFWETLSYNKVNSSIHSASTYHGNKTNSPTPREKSVLRGLR